MVLNTAAFFPLMANGGERVPWFTATVTRLTVNGQAMGENCGARRSENLDVIKSAAAPIKPNAGFINLSGNLFDSAIMKTSVISDSFRATYLSNPEDMNAFEGRAVVFDGPDDFHHRIDDPT